MNIPIHLPLLHRYLKGEDNITRSHRHSSVARFVIFADACTDHDHGLGYYIPLCGWDSLDIPTLTQYYTSDGLLHNVDINILEFIAVIVGLCAAIRMLHHDITFDMNSHTHIHVWTDNTSCQSWMLCYWSNHPLHSFLIQMFVLLQVQFRIVVTVGHYPGSINVYADAASRKFCVPHGEQYQRELSLLPLLPYPHCLIQDIVAIATKRLVNTSSLARDALISLGGVHGWITHSATGSITR